jgi:hypothetical protein
MTTDEDRAREAAEAELRAIVAEYEAAPEKALQARDAGIRSVAEKGLRQVDIIRITGYSRETVRQALKPEAREAARRAVAERARTAAPQPDVP